MHVKYVCPIWPGNHRCCTRGMNTIKWPTLILNSALIKKSEGESLTKGKHFICKEEKEVKGKEKIDRYPDTKESGKGMPRKVEDVWVLCPQLALSIWTSYWTDSIPIV